MAGSYGPEHASALADVLAAGQAIAFASRTPGTLNEANGRYAGGGSASVGGAAIRVKDRPKEYEALGLVQTEAATLFFVPTTYGQLPPLGAVGVFGGTPFTIKGILPIAPDGVVIAARLLVQR